MSGTGTAPWSDFAGTSTIEKLDRQLREFFRNQGRSPEDTADLVQDTWMATARFRGESSLRFFLFRVARNKLTDVFRRFERLEGTIVAKEQLQAQAGPREETPQDVSVERTRFRRAVAELPEVFRDTMVLSLTGMTHVEIGEALDVPGNTVRSRLSRGRGRLKQQFGPEAEDETDE